MSCVRSPTAVALWVDGKRAATAAGATGFIGNDAPVRIGGKKIKPGNKQYHGALDSVFLRFL
jgi:hypothetical protein